MAAFGVDSIDTIILKRKVKFLRKFINNPNTACLCFDKIATDEVVALEGTRPP